MDKCYGIIYKSINKVNGEAYIGQTTKSLHRRMNEHIKDALSRKYGMYFHNAIRKYGKENFRWEIIAECNSLEELNKIEIEMIKEHNTFNNGYNLNLGGNGNAGCRHTEESRKKRSESMKGKNHPNYGKRLAEETKRKIGNANRGKTQSEEARKRNSESNMGEKNHFYGKHHTEEAKKKMSEAHGGKKHYNYGKHLPEETRKRIGDGNKGKIGLRGKDHPNYGKHLAEETKRRISNAHEGKKLSEKTKSKISKAGSKRYKVTTPEGGIIFIHGLNKFCRNYRKEKLHPQNLIKVAQGKQEYTKGYKCKYWEEKLNAVQSCA